VLADLERRPQHAIGGEAAILAGRLDHPVGGFGPILATDRNGEAAEVVARMRDWPVFAQACDRLLAPEGSSPAPVIGGNA